MNETINDGGPAFPSKPELLADGTWATHNFGMSLRAWLAGQALAGAIASIADGTDFPIEKMAPYCVSCADAIINELDKP